MFTPRHRGRRLDLAHHLDTIQRGHAVRIRMLIPTVVLGAALIAATGCGGDDTTPATTGAATATTASGSITGSGSSFVYPLVSKWIPSLRDQGLDVTYSPDGSGAGVAAITARTVDFGASDAPLSEEQFAACKECVQIPWALSATSVAFNLDGIDTIKLTGELLAQIYLGEVKAWDDPAIAELNPGVELPSTPVRPVYRSDSSGTSYNFTDFLSEESPAWKSQVGRGTNANWPAGTGAKGSSGVAGVVAKTEGALTYVDVAYARENDLATASVRNAAGEFVDPELEAIGKAAAAVDMASIPDTGEISVVAPPASAKGAYPICTFTYVILAKASDKAAQVKALVEYALGDGQDAGPDLLFRPLPEPVRTFGREQLALVG